MVRPCLHLVLRCVFINLVDEADTFPFTPAVLISFVHFLP